MGGQGIPGHQLQCDLTREVTVQAPLHIDLLELRMLGIRIGRQLTALTAQVGSFGVSWRMLLPCFTQSANIANTDRMEGVSMNENVSRTSRSAGSSAAVGFLIGATLGAGIALLLAPRSGRQSRRRLADAGAKRHAANLVKPATSATISSET